MSGNNLNQFLHCTQTLIKQFHFSRIPRCLQLGASTTLIQNTNSRSSYLATTL